MLEAQTMNPAAMTLAQAAGAVAPAAAGAQVPGGPAVGAGGVLPYTQTTVEGPSSQSHSSNSYDTKTPEIIAAEKGVAQAAADKRAAINAEMGANVAKEAINAQSADSEAKIHADAEKERDALNKRVETLTAASLAEQKKAREELKSHRPTSYIEDMGPFRRVISALSLGAGALGAGMTGGPNHAFEVFKAGENDWRKKQEAILAEKVRNVEMSTGDLKQAQELLVSGMANIQNRAMARLEYLRSTTNAQIKRVPTAAIEGQKILAGIDQEEGKQTLAQANLFKRHHESGGTSSTGKTTVTSVEGDKGTGGSRGLSATKDAVAFANTQENEKKAIELRDLMDSGVALTRRQIARIEDNKNRMIARQKAEGESVAQSTMGEWARKWGVLPADMFAGAGLTAKQKRLYQLEWTLAEPQAIAAVGGNNFMGNERTYLDIVGNRVQGRSDNHEMAQAKRRALVDEIIAAANEARRVSKAGTREAALEAREAKAAPQVPPMLTRPEVAPQAAPSAREKLIGLSRQVQRMTPDQRAAYQDAKRAFVANPKQVDPRVLHIVDSLSQQLNGGN